jgi:hypothetical protein
VGFANPGIDYLAGLEHIHRLVRPRLYLEIGTWTGRSLALARCKSIAVDPKFDLAPNATGDKPIVHLFQMTSDEFFRHPDAQPLMAPGVDLAFIDGLHHYEVTLRDFINVERHCGPDGVIAIHDCFPLDAYVARRDFDDRSLLHISIHPWGQWSGDVWKALLIIAAHRPELTIRCFDCEPTGLVTVSGLQPGSHVLESVFDEAVAEMRERSFDRDAHRQLASLGIIPAAALSAAVDAGLLHRA